MTVRQLNELLRQELGSNPYGEGIFSWRWSEDCYWPATKTGRMVTKKVEVPLIGGGVETAEIPTPEYSRSKQKKHLHRQWVVCKWLSPSELAGLTRGVHIGQDAMPQFYPEDVIKERWERIFPGSEYPSRGVHFATDYYNKTGVEPGLDDTKFLIHQLREQMSGMSEQARLADMQDDHWNKIERTRKRTEDIAEECFTAFLNPKSGARGGFVSFGGSDFTKEHHG